MQIVTRSLGLIDGALRDDPEANRLFLEILSSRKNAELVLRAHERDRRPRPLHPGLRQDRRDDAVQHVPPLHRRRAPDPRDRHPRRDRARRGGGRAPAGERDLSRASRTGSCSMSPLFLHDIAKGRPEDHSIEGARLARKLCPRLGLSAAQTETVAWLVEHHLLMSDDGAVARPQRPQDHPRLRRGGAEPRAAEDAPHPHRLPTSGGGPRRLERLEGPAAPHPLLRDRAGAHRRPQPGEPRPARHRGARGAGRGARRLAEARARRLSRPPLPGLLAPRRPAADSSPMPNSSARPTARSGALATAIRTRDFEAVTEITVFAPDHPRLLSIIAGACTIAGANIVDAQIFTTTDGQALDIDLDLARVRRRRRRGAAGAEGRRPDRAGARGLAPHSRAGGAADQEEAALQGLQPRDPDQRRQCAVEPLHRGRSLGP